MRQQRGTGRRVHETRTQLRNALASLVHEKPYDDIVVTEIVARADVGRSTFYAHYRDKDELLERGIRDLLRLDAQPRERWTCATERILRFSLPFLEHVARYREHGVLPMNANGAAAIHDHLHRVLEDALALELRAESRRRPDSPLDSIPPRLVARYVAGTFVVALGWWLEEPTRSARDVDVWFRALVEPVLARVLNGER
jgi:AcrR family transcriptional regulator